MANAKLLDMVLETATNPGTGSFTLAGAVSGRLPFSSGLASNDLVFYYASDGNQTEWGEGTFVSGSPNVLQRTTVIGTTNGGTAPLNFSGTVNIYSCPPAERMPLLDDAGCLPVGDVSDVTSACALNAKSAGTLFYPRTEADSTFLSQKDASSTYAQVSETTDYVEIKVGDGRSLLFFTAQQSGTFENTGWPQFPIPIAVTGIVSAIGWIRTASAGDNFRAFRYDAPNLTLVGTNAKSGLTGTFQLLVTTS